MPYKQMFSMPSIGELYLSLCFAFFSASRCLSVGNTRLMVNSMDIQDSQWEFSILLEASLLIWITDTE